jgi:hypothetical protein
MELLTTSKSQLHTTTNNSPPNGVAVIDVGVGVGVGAVP